MAESAFYLVPSDPLHLPPEEKRLAALEFFEEVSPLPNANGDYYFYVYDSPKLFTSGEGLEAAICPLCKARLDLYEYEEERESDFAISLDEAIYDGNLEQVQLFMPCCQGQVSPLLLEFDMPSYFAKFAIGALEPSRSHHWEGELEDYHVGSGSLKPETLNRFSEILGCSVNQMWEVC